MRKINLSTGEYYHIYNRGVEKRDIFLDKSDFFRFLIEMREFNDCSDVRNLGRKSLSEASPQSNNKLVEIICYCLMTNHFHLILRQLEDTGISRFMQKVATGYVMYFNLKYQHTGVLFQGPFKAKHIENDQYLLHLSRYIHLNPVEIFSDSNDKQRIVNNVETYRWSSLPFYLDQTKPCIINLNKEIITRQFQNIKNLREFIFNYLDFRPEILESLKIE